MVAGLVSCRSALVRPIVAASRQLSSSAAVSAPRKPVKIKAPKQLTSRWQVYLRDEWQRHRDNRDRTSPDQAQLSMSQFTRQAAERYRQLSLEEQEKLEGLLASEREQYARDLAEYKAAVALEDDDAEVASKPTTRKKDRALDNPTEPKPERAKTGYMLYLEDERAQNPDIKDLKTLSHRWKELSEEQREGYRESAKPDQARYLAEKAEWDARQNKQAPQRRRRTVPAA